MSGLHVTVIETAKNTVVWSKLLRYANSFFNRVRIESIRDKTAGGVASGTKALIVAVNEVARIGQILIIDTSTGAFLFHKQYSTNRLESGAFVGCAFDLIPSSLLFVQDISGPILYLINSPDSNVLSDTYHSKFELLKFILTPLAT